MHPTMHATRLGFRRGIAAVSSAAFAWACSTEAPIALSVVPPSSIVRLASENAKPNFNLEVILRAADGADGFGLVKFRQANDEATVVDLDVWVRDLAANTHYRLQRAVDMVVDDECTSASWLTLGKGIVPQDIVTDDRGTGREDLFRLLTVPVGTAFDIHFRVVTATTPPTVVLMSECYQFFVR